MVVIRSTKCSTKFATHRKKDKLEKVLSEYGNVVNFFIEFFWPKEKLPSKNELLKPIIDLPKNVTWLSSRLRKVAAREALDIISATKERWKKSPEKMGKPLHKGTSMSCSATIAERNISNTTFDLFLKMRSMGNKLKIDIPIKKHKHFNKLEASGKILNAYIITKEYVQFCFEIETGTKKDIGKTIGIDTGIKCLATTNSGQRIGENLEEIITKINRCKNGSKRQKKLRNFLRHYIDTCAKKVFEINPNLQRIVVERLKNMNFNTKKKRKLGKGMRKIIGSWNYRYWLSRLEGNCEMNRVRFTSVFPAYTSQICNSCGHTDKKNRLTQDSFQCVSCGCIDHADTNAAKNILDRGISLIYRWGQEKLEKQRSKMLSINNKF